MDTHSVNLSQDAEEVCAIYQTGIVPVSAGTPQEMSFAESRVRVVKRMSTVTGPYRARYAPGRSGGNRVEEEEGNGMEELE